MAKLVKVVSLFDAESATRAATSYVAPNYSPKWLYTSANYDGTIEVYFEAVLKISSGSYTAYAELYNGTSQVAEVSTSSTTTTRVRSGDIFSSLSNGVQYNIRLKSSSSSGTATIYAARLIIVQSGTVTKTETIISLGSSSVFTSTTYIEESLKGRWKYIAADWDGITGVYYEVFGSVANASATGYFSSYEAGVGVVTNGEATTGATSDTRTRSGNWSSYLVDGAQYYGAAKTSNASYGARSRSARIIIVQSSFTKTVSYYPVGVYYAQSLAETTFDVKVYYDAQELDVSSAAYYFISTCATASGAGPGNVYLNDGSSDVASVTTTTATRDFYTSSSFSPTDNTEYVFKTSSTGTNVVHLNSAIMALFEISAGGTSYDNSVSLARSLGVANNGLFTGVGSVSLGRSLGVDVSGLLTAAGAVGLGRSLGVDLSGVLTIELTADLARALGVSASGLLTAAGSVGLGRALGVTTNAIFVQVVSLNLARALGVSTSGVLNIGPTLSLGRALSLSDTAGLIGGGSLNLNRIVQVTTTAAGTFGANVALGRGLAVSLLGGLTVEGSLSLARSLGITPGAIFVKLLTLSLGRSLGVSTSGLLTAAGSFSLARQVGISSASQLTAAGSLVLARSQGVNQTAQLVGVASLGLGRALTFVPVGGLTIEASVAIARYLAVALSGAIELPPTIYIDWTLGARSVDWSLLDRSVDWNLYARLLDWTLKDRDNE